MGKLRPPVHQFVSPRILERMMLGYYDGMVGEYNPFSMAYIEESMSYGRIYTPNNKAGRYTQQTTRFINISYYRIPEVSHSVGRLCTARYIRPMDSVNYLGSVGTLTAYEHADMIKLIEHFTCQSLSDFAPNF